MPASIVLAAIGATLTGVPLAIATFAINFAASYIITRVFGQQASKQQDSGVRQQVPPSSTNSIPVVYGDAWMGGTFVDAVLTTDQQAMYYVMAISNISPNGQFTYDTTKFYYGDRLITFDVTDPTKVVSLTDGAGNVDTKINGNLFINLYTSTTAGVITNVTGTAPSTFMGGSDIAAGLRWTGTRQMNGLAFAIIKLIYNRDAGTTSLQPVTFKVKHALNGTGFAKPGDVLFDYLTQNYGGAVLPANVNSTACAALNAYSDATISYTPSGGGSATQARYRINGVIDTGRAVLDNVDKILTSCDSWLAYQASTGQWAPVINKAESTSFAFDDTNIIGDIKVSVVDLASSINQIEVSFPFKDNKDQPEYVFLQTPSGLLYPNEPVNKYTTSFDLVNDSVQASYLANRILEQAREDLIVSFSTAYTGIQVDAGDVISITNTDYGWSAKLFRVTKVQEASLPDGNLGARIECSEYNSAVYDDASITQFTAVPNSGLTSGYYFPPLAAPTFADQSPSLNPPTFSAICNIPTSGRVTTVTLYYTDAVTPLQKDWKVWTIQTASYGDSFTPGIALKFPNIIVGSGTYYFAFTVGNELATSDLSTTSSAFNWTTVTAGSFIATFSPASNSVSRTGGTPTFTGLVTRLYGSAFGATVDFVTSQTDADAAFVNNTWRIGGSSTTGNADITTTGGLTMGSITDGGTYAQWGIPTAMTSSPATLTVPVRYKNSAGVVSQAATASLQFIFVDNGTNGTDGTKSASPAVYQWAASIPAGPTGTSTYTWATNTIGAAPAGWTLTPGTSPSPGFTLWAATVNLVVSAGVTSSTINWTTATILAVGAAGTNGTNGVNGNDGSSSRICFSRIAGNPSPISGNITVSGDNRPSSIQSNTTWGLNVSWFASDPNPSSTDSLYQADGVYNPVTNQTVWSTPYISSLKVGTLSAITVNTGALTVQDALTINTAGHIKGGQTAYNTGTGFFLGYSGAAYKFSIGSSTQSLKWDGTSLIIDGQLNCTTSYQSGLFYTIAKFTDPGGAFASDINIWSTNTKSNGTAVAGYATYLGVIGTTSTYRGVQGQTTGGTSTSAVYGDGGSGVGVDATSSYIGVRASRSGTGTALYVDGPMQITTTSLVTNLNADQLDGKHASAFVEIASGTTNAKYLYYVNNNTAPTDPNNRAAWIKVSTNDGAVVWFPGYV